MISKYYIDSIFDPSNTGLILGQKGSGKTNFACVLMELLVKFGYHVFTNIHFFEYSRVGEACNAGRLAKGIYYETLHQNIHQLNGIKELMEYMVQFKGKKVAIIDEGGIHASSSQPMSTSTVTIKQLAYIIRHFDTCMVLIAQTEGSLPPDLRKTLIDWQLRTEKMKRRVSYNKRIYNRDADTGKEIIFFKTTKKWVGTPHTVYPVDGTAPTGFDIPNKVSLKKLLADLNKAGSSLDVMGPAGLAVIKKYFGEDKPKRNLPRSKDGKFTKLR